MAKIIYQPKGKAKEYSPWAANFYNGCSNKCEYCYNRHCQAKGLLGKDIPTLKNGLTESNVVDIFKKELEKYRERIILSGGLFFNFVSDPMLPETRKVNIACILHCVKEGVPVIVLTKCADWYDCFVDMYTEDNEVPVPLIKKMVKFGFTLTGCDDQEHGNSSTTDRIELMKKLHEKGYYTWASIEPVIHPLISLLCIERTLTLCDEYRIGLLSGKKIYGKQDIILFLRKVRIMEGRYGLKVAIKSSVVDFIK